MKSTNSNAKNIVKPAIKPPESWNQKTTFGFMGFDSTEGGRLVRLADVLRWLGEHPSPMPYALALEALCSNMPSDVMQWIYQVQPGGGYAQPLPVGFMFGYMTKKQIEDSNLKARQSAIQRDLMAQRKTSRYGEGWHMEAGKVTITSQQPVEPGLPALLKCIRATWTSEAHKGEPSIDNKKATLSFLAVPFGIAERHWGWGYVVKGEAVENSPSVDKAVELAALLSAYEKRSSIKTVTREQFASDRGLTVPNLKKLLGEAKASRKTAETSPFKTLMVVNGKKKK